MRLLAATLLAGLALAAAPARSQAAGKEASIKELGRRWQAGDAAAARELIARARAAPPGQTDALDALIPKGVNPPDSMGLVIDELDALARQAGHSPDSWTRTLAGELGQEVEHWRNFDSPQALAGKRRYERRQFLESAKEFAVLLLIPLLAIAGALWIVVTRGAIVGILIGSSKAFSRAFGDAGAVVEREHRAVLLMPAAAAVTSVVLGITLFKAAGLATPAATSAEVPELAWKAVLSARVLSAYFGAGFAFFFMHAMFLTMMLAVARGGRPDFAAAFRAAARRWRDILLLSAAAFGGILLVAALTSSGVKKARAVLPPAEARLGAQLLGLAAWLLETGFTVASVVMLAIAMNDGVGLLEAARRAGRLLATKARPAVLAMLGIEAAGGDAVGGVTSLLLLGGIGSIPLIGMLAPAIFSGRFAPETTAYLLVYGPMSIGILGGALMYSGLLALESIFAAGMYSYASDDAVQGPLFDALRAAEPQLAGMLAPLSGRGAAAGRSPPSGAPAGPRRRRA